MFISLNEQIHVVADKTSILSEILKHLGIEERGGGPEGIYYTHSKIEGEYLYRSLPVLVYKIKEYYESEER